MATINYDDNEVLGIKAIAEMFDSGRQQTSPDHVAGVDPAQARKMLRRFSNHRLVFANNEYSGDESYNISPTILDVYDQIVNPPKPDYVKQLSKWWRSSKLLVGISVGIIGLPLVYQWYEMIRDLANWLVTK